MLRPWIAFDERQEIFAARVDRLTHMWPALLLADFHQQLSQPALAVIWLAGFSAHQIHAGRLNQPLQRFDRVKWHGPIVAGTGHTADDFSVGRVGVPSPFRHVALQFRESKSRYSEF